MKSSKLKKKAVNFDWCVDLCYLIMQLNADCLIKKINENKINLISMDVTCEHLMVPKWV